VLAYAMWPSARPSISEAGECADSAGDSATQIALQEQVAELEAARRRLETEVQALRQLANRGQDTAPEKSCADELIEAHPITRAAALHEIRPSTRAHRSR
jgi:hypothetical protein